jgi:hypothetical protein
MAIKRYRGKITKGKRKGKQGFVTLREYLKQNIIKPDFNESSLNAGELKEYNKILKNQKISLKAKQRVRIKGRFLDKEQNKFLRKTLKDLGKEFNQKNVDEYYKNEIFFTFQSWFVSDVINDHKGPVQLNGKEFSKTDAIIEFDILNKENYREWSDFLNIDEAAIIFIIYDATYNPATQVLNIDTMVNDESRVVTSDPILKAARQAAAAAEKAKQKKSKK